MILYGAGCAFGQDQLPAFCARHRIGKLYSFNGPGERKIINRWAGRIKLMVDSGAHSWNKIHTVKVGATKSRPWLTPVRKYIPEYIEFIREHKDRKHLTFVELDVYRFLPKEEIDQMWRDVMAIPDRQFEYIRVYHPVMDNGTLEVLDEWIAEGHTYVGIGRDSQPIFHKIFAKTRDKVRVHGFAVLGRKILETYPFYSADSTTPVTPAMYALHIDRNFKLRSKVNLRENKRMEALLDTKYTTFKAFLAMKYMQDELTLLWENRGVKWPIVY